MIAKTSKNADHYAFFAENYLSINKFLWSYSVIMKEQLLNILEHNASLSIEELAIRLNSTDDAVRSAIKERFRPSRRMPRDP